MKIFEESLLRFCLKPTVESSLPGRIRLSFRCYKQLPKAALPYIHYVEDVLLMLPGICEVSLNDRIGTVLVRYRLAETSEKQILQWIDTVVNTGIELAKEIDCFPLEEKEMAHIVRQRLIAQLPYSKKASPC